MKRALLVLALLALSACARNAPISLSPAGVVLWQADAAVVALGTVQTSAIGLNKIQVCNPAPCHPLLSDNATRGVIDAVTDGVNTIRHVPAGWKGTALATLDVTERRLDAAGITQLRPYLIAARAALSTE